MSSPRRDGQTPDRMFAAILILGALMRFATVPVPIVHQPDEIWQYIEPGYGILTGHWIKTWEFVAGARSYLVPIFLLGPQALGLAIAPHGQLHIELARLTCAILSLVVIIAAYGIGKRIGRTHALISSFVAATWFEFVYFAARTSADSIALSLLVASLPGLAELRFNTAKMVGISTGLLVGLAVLVRPQLAPALFILSCWGAGVRPRSWALLGSGIAGAFAIDAAVELAAGMTPFLWIFRITSANLVQGKATTFGIEPVWWYAEEIWRIWGWPTVGIIACAVVGTRRYPALALAALAIFVVHACLPHKEYRYVITCEALVVLLAAIGSADLIQWVQHRISAPARSWLVAFLCAVWFIVSITDGASDAFAANWSSGKPPFIAYRMASKVPGLCGIGEYRPSYLPNASYAVLTRDVPLYLIGGTGAANTLRSSASGFNVIVTSQRYIPVLPPSYRLIGCPQALRPDRIRDDCVFVRPGLCSPGLSSIRYENALIRFTQHGSVDPGF